MRPVNDGAAAVNRYNQAATPNTTSSHGRSDEAMASKNYAIRSTPPDNGTTYYYRLIAHAADVGSQPGPVFQARADLGGL